MKSGQPYLPKQLLCIASVVFLTVVAVTSGEADSRPGGAVSRKAAKVRKDAKHQKPAKTVISGDQTAKLDAAVTAPIQKYAPSFPSKSFPITARQLLGHLSGVRNYKSGEGERTNRYESLTDALAVFKDDPLEHEPGTKYTYTTLGYTLLGVVI